MNDTASCRYPWKTKRPELPTEIATFERMVNTEASSEITSCQIRKSEEAPRFDEIISPELSPGPSSSNDDLKELERSLIDMKKYVDELQFELLKCRQTEEVKQVSANQPSLPFEEFLKGLQSISDSLETHKTDYALVADMQAENVQLREELIKVTEENERLRNQLEALKQSHEAEVESLKAANDEKVTALNKDYEEKLKKQSEEFSEMLGKERADFATQRDAWNEEKATLLVEHAKELAQMMKIHECKSVGEETSFRAEFLREVNEVQNQIREQAAQWQSKIERLLVNSTPSARSYRRADSVGALRGVGNRPSSGAHALFQTPQQTVGISLQKSSMKAPVTSSAIIQPQTQDITIRAGQKRFYFSRPPDTESVGISKGKLVKIAAVPPILVTSEEPHPLLEDSSIVPVGEERNTDCIELPNPKWCGNSELMDFREVQASYFNSASVNGSKIDVMPTDEWFNIQEGGKSQMGEIEQQNQCQVADNSLICFRPNTPMQLPQPWMLQPKHQAQPQVPSVPKKRHLFTVRSEDS
ncbi:hypothetical protein Aperf_G00000124711 [Anoplocephala perfoliata]